MMNDDEGSYCLQCAQGWINNSGAPYIGNVPHDGAVDPTLLCLYGGVKQHQKGRKRLEILQTGQRAHRHHAARQGSKKIFETNAPPPKKWRRRVASAKG